MNNATRSRSRVTRTVLPLALAATLAPEALAQDARVVAANASNNQVLEYSFDPPGTFQLNDDANRRVRIQDLVFRDDGAGGLHLVAADEGAGEVVFYPDGAGTGLVVSGGEIPFPDGLSQDPARNLFGVSSSTGVGPEKDARVWMLLRDPGCDGGGPGCRPGGYAPALGSLDSRVEALTSVGGVPTMLEVDLLAETFVVKTTRGAYTAGDLLVLAADPAMLLRYPAADVAGFVAALSQGGAPAELQPEVLVHPPFADAPTQARFPVGAEPNGMDFTPDGDLLVSSGDGLILSFLPDATRRRDAAGAFVDFATGLGQGKFKLAVGPQGGRVWAFVSDRNGGELLRFLVRDDGTGLLDTTVADPEFPVGIATTTSSVVPTPAGSGVTIRPSSLMTSTIENVLVGGSTSVTAVLFEDPRELEVPTPFDQPLHRPLLLGELSSELPPNVEIPAYVRAFPKDDAVSGPPTFLLLVADTNTDVLGLVAHVIAEEDVLGYKPACDDPDATAQPRMFWVPTPGEASIVEGEVFIDVSNDCGTTRGLTRYWSLFLASARDTRPSAEILADKLGNLGRVLDQAQCIDRRLKKSLERQYASMMRVYERGQLDRTRTELEAFIALAAGAPGGFSACADNEGGELRARGESAIFILNKLLQ